MLFPFKMGLWAPVAAGADVKGCLGFLPPADPTTSLVGKLCDAANTYTGFSINAFNLWRNPWTGLGDTLQRGDDTVVGLVLGGVSLTWQQVGTLLFVGFALLALVVVARRDDIRGVVLSALLLAITFFALPTRVHERYLFPALALGALLIFSGRIWPWLYGAISVVFFANIYWLYSEDWSYITDRVYNPGVGGLAMVQDPFLASTLLTDAGIWLLGLLITAVLGVVAWLAIRLALSPREAAEPEEIAAAESASTARHHRTPLPSAAGGPAWLSPNPADAYLREPRRRLDRRDALILLGLVAFALVFRLWRLDLPRSQHFDEAYHARSAAEFLERLGARLAPRRLRVDPPDAGQVPDRRRDRRGRPEQGRRQPPAGRPVAGPGGRAAPRVERLRALDRLHGGRRADDRGSGRRDRRRGRELDGRRTDRDAGLRSRGTAPPRGSPRFRDGRDVRARGPACIARRTRAAGRAVDRLRSRDGERDRRSRRTPPIRPCCAAPAASRSSSRTPTPCAARSRGPSAASPTPTASMPSSRTRWSPPSLRPARSAIFDAETLESRPIDALGVDATLVGPIVVRGSGDDQQLLALTGPLPATDEHPATNGGIAVGDADGSNNRCSGDPCVLGLVAAAGRAAPDRVTGRLRPGVRGRHRARTATTRSGRSSRTWRRVAPETSAWRHSTPRSSTALRWRWLSTAQRRRRATTMGGCS